MYSFFVLGQVPGTSITITFTMWMELCAAAVMVTLWLYVRHRNTESTSELQPTIGNDEATSFRTITAR